MDEYSQVINIPGDRVAVLIGEGGSVKKELEKEFSASIEISGEGQVSIVGRDSLKVWVCEKVVKAVGRGFNPEKALLLKDDDWEFDLINIGDYGRSPGDLKRLRGRVIGRDGKAKSVIEEITGCYISVYGKTVGIISPVNTLDLAHDAVVQLLNGAKHSTVYRFLEKQRVKQRGV